MPRRRALRLTAIVAAVVVLVLVAASVFALVVYRRPLPQTSGSLELETLTSEVEVVRDSFGIPQISADNAPDLFRAQGFVHAQDRFFEMDYRRHVTAGRLSELVGENADALAADKVIRTFGWRRVAEQEWALLQADTREYLTAYAEGVNAYLDSRQASSLAFEYTVLGLQVDVAQPADWDPIDSLAWLKAMAWDLRGNYDKELARATSYSAVRDVARVDELFPAYPQDINLPILPGPEAVVEAANVEVAPTSAIEAVPVDLASSALQDAVQAADDALAAVPHLLGEGEGIGSNSWAVGGEHTVSGQPILANDPHQSISAPGIWSQVGLHCREVTADCPFDVAGYSFAGFPGVVIGHNDQLAWGFTNMGADVTDFFIERVSGDQYLFDTERLTMTSRTEIIKVNGADDVQLTVQETGHGPIVSSVLQDTNSGRIAPIPENSPVGVYEVSLGWTALTPGRTADAMFAMNTAHDAAEIAAAAALFEVPAQNIVFATTAGDIGYQAPGSIPIRAVIGGGPVPSDGTWPRPGWDSRYDWQGYVAAARMPAAINPAEGFIVAANQAVNVAGVGPFLAADWDYGYRSQRIRELLTERIAEGTSFDVAEMTAIQLDDANPYAAELVPVLLNMRLDSSFDRSGQDLLRGWDGRNTTDSAAAAYFAAVWANLLELTFWDELPTNSRPDGGSRWLEVIRGMLDRPDDPWWDDRTTVGVVEGRDEMLSRALTSARLELTAELGKSPSDWAWGKLHVASPQHPVLGGPDVPNVIRRLVNPSALSVAGGSSLVNATSWDAADDTYAVTSAPSMRMVVDLDDLDASTWVTLTGSSAHPASAHYDDQFEAWASGETYPWPFSADAVEDAARDRLTLRPGA